MSTSSAVSEWAAQLALSYESGAHGQFILYGNIHDRLIVGGQMVNLVRYLRDELLAKFQVVFTYDLGNGLRVERGGEVIQQWRHSENIQHLPRDPLPAVDLISHFIRYLYNLRALGRGGSEHIACIVRGVDQIVPAGPGAGYEQGGLASLFRDWASEPPYSELPFASLLIADNINDVDAAVAFNPRVSRVRLPLPSRDDLVSALSLLRDAHPAAFDTQMSLPETASALVGVTVSAVESLTKIRAHERKALSAADWSGVKKQLVEKDAAGLVEFIESSRSLDDYHGQDALKTWLRQDVALWRAGDTRALPKGYLFCGPVGTGKTYLVECLAGDAGVPVVKLKNFRDRWVGSSEGNLEKIFRLVRALGRCMVFVDEADQTLGRRESGSGDSGLSGRLYSMIAQEMGDSDNRGRVIWILASSRPDLIEVDIKRPGRVDVKVPLLPTTTPHESMGLLRALCKRFDLLFDDKQVVELTPEIPTLMTPGAAEALAVKAYRLARTQNLDAVAAIRECLDGYQPPVPRDIMELQMRLAIRESSDLEFVPEALRHYAEPGQ